ncbi:outer membrane protein assembly factor BamD [Candidatus Halobeggiatoa sp. HSG11]|nr:outer membrane protein assembly factor BamD [Candidatus Halobeggiatoa sp. HSG11]
MKYIIITILSLNLLACGVLSEPETEKWSANKIYEEAKDAFAVGDFESAIRYYELLEARYPFGKYAQQAQLEIIYSYFKYEEPASAIAAADLFIKLYPRHPKVDYAYYLKGLVNFELHRGTLDRFLPVDRSQREQTAAVQSFQDFSELIARFPDSEYSKDARQRLVHLRNRAAQHELHVANFYMKREAYLAAANRAKIVIESYQRTPSVPYALIILARAYKIMGLQDLSDSTLDVLKLNYPDHHGIAKIENLVAK